MKILALLLGVSESLLLAFGLMSRTFRKLSFIKQWGFANALTDALTDEQLIVTISAATLRYRCFPLLAAGEGGKTPNGHREAYSIIHN